MPKEDKYRYLPWLGVGLSALILGAIGRHIALKVSEDTGTANITFIIIIVGVVLLYVTFIALWETIHQVVFKKKEPKEVVQETESEEKEAGLAEEDVKSEEIDKLPANSVLRKKIDVFCKYTDNILAGPIAVEDLPLLHKYIEQYANKNLGDIPQRIKTHTVDTFDLCHYGWNIWNHFDKVAGQEETAEWLVKVFEQLKGISPNTIHKKFTHRERMTYTIPIEDDIK